jgi:hypothetical protein
MKWTTLILTVLLLTCPISSFVLQRRLIAPKFSSAIPRVFLSTSKAPTFRQTTRFAENASLDGNETDDSKDDNTKSVASRDHDTEVNMFPLAYVVAKYLFAATSILIFATPDLSWGLMLRQKWSGGAGYACAAALCDILQNAQANGRQSSDTYKRLHIALALFSGISLTAVPGEAGFFRAAQQGPMLSILTGVRSMGTLVALWGWKASIQQNVVQELTRGAQRIARTG